MANTYTVTVQQGVNGQINVVGPVNNYPVPVQSNNNITLTNGSGFGQVNQVYLAQRIIPASGADTIDLKGGTITGSETVTLTMPDNEAFALTANIKAFEIQFWPGTGNSSITITAGGSSGFAGWFGSGETVGNSSLGGGCSHIDLRGFTVDNTHKNLVITNNDASNASTFTLMMAGV